ncbi:MAG: hypothetical protein V2A73_10340 [Pseudomonadota bacterium]
MFRAQSTHAGYCEPGLPVNCDDGNPCTTDTCSPENGCDHKPVRDGVDCEDGAYCTENDICLGGRCTPGSPRDCDDNTDDANQVDDCHVLECDEEQNACVEHQRPAGTECHDGDACGEHSYCNEDGLCVGTCRESFWPRKAAIAQDAAGSCR